MEKRRFARQSISGGSALMAKVIMSGGSLLETTSPRSIEIGATPLDISRGGVCLSLKLDVPWETLTPHQPVSLLLTLGDQAWLLPAIVVRHEKNHRTIGFQFSEPLTTIAPFLAPPELH